MPIQGCSNYNFASYNKSKKVDLHLPEEIIFMILVFVPGDILHNSIRLVCKQWNRIISDPIFIKEHLVRASSLIVPFIPLSDSPSFSKEVDSFDIGETNVITKPINLPFPGMVSSSCDGLLLLHDMNVTRVVNPTTKQMCTLPSLNISLSSSIDGISSIAPVISGKKYKVIVTFLDLFSGCYRVFIVPLGRKAKWREIHKGKQCCINNDPKHIFGWPPYATQGFFHWRNEVGANYVSLDLKTETFYQFLCPWKGRKDVKTACFETWKNEFYCMLEGERVTEFLKLTDPKNGGWTKIYKANYPFWSLGNPFAWFKHGDLIVLIDGDKEAETSIVCNLKTGRKDILNYKFDPNFMRHRDSYFNHVNTLVQLPLKHRRQATLGL